MRVWKLGLVSIIGLAAASLGDESVRHHFFRLFEAASERVGGASGARAAALKTLSSAVAAVSAPAYPFDAALPPTSATIARKQCTPRRRAIAALSDAVEGVEPLERLVLAAAPLLGGDDVSTQGGPPPKDAPPGGGTQPVPPPSSGPGVLPAPVIPVPEPSTWVVMIAGFGLVGAALRRRARGSIASRTEPLP